MKSIKSIMKKLFFDKELVSLAKENNVNKEMLYNHLTNGKITLQEYISLM